MSTASQPAPRSALHRFFVTIAEAPAFRHVITAVILLAGLVVGVETYPRAYARYGHLLHRIDLAIMVVFTLEIVIKVAGERRRASDYFRDPWNLFDFAIVAVCLLPYGGISASVFRLARLLRILKLINTMPRLQILVGALFKSIPSMAYVSVFLAMLFYIYACTGVFLFAENDPDHFGTLEHALVSLFHLVTLEDWTDMMHIAIYGCANTDYAGTCEASHAFGWLGALYYISFVMVGTMIILNLFIGIVLNGMEEAHREAELRAALARDVDPDSTHSELAQLRREVSTLRDSLDRISALADQIEAQS